MFQLRETVFQFSQKELAPYADEIDKTNSFPQMRVSNLSHKYPAVDIHLYMILC